jgi:hypothetical protein
MGDTARGCAIECQRERDGAAGEALRIVDEAVAMLAQVRSFPTLLEFDFDELRRMLDRVATCRTKAPQADLSFRRFARRLGG